VPHRIDGMRERWNYVNAWADKTWSGGKTRVGVFGYDHRLKGWRTQDSSYALHHEKGFVDGNLIPRFYGLFQPDHEEFSEIVGSVEAMFFKKRLKLRPGYLYYSRDRRFVHLPNSNLFAPGRDHNNMFFMVEAALPRPQDSLYIGATTSAKNCFARNATRVEGGVFLRFPSIPGLP
jgi:hypothetical protein